jgi:hypothetical protein
MTFVYSTALCIVYGVVTVLSILFVILLQSDNFRQFLEGTHNSMITALNRFANFVGRDRVSKSDHRLNLEHHNNSKRFYVD